MSANADDLRRLPILPRDFEERTKSLSEKDRDARKAELSKQFSSAKWHLIELIQFDRNGLMNATAKLVAIHLITYVNFETGQCNPSHRTIADGLGLKVRTVERAIANISKAGWIEKFRSRRTTSNQYEFCWSAARENAILDYMTTLHDRRKEDRLRRGPKVLAGQKVDHMNSTPRPTKAALELSVNVGLAPLDQTDLSKPDPSELAVQDNLDPSGLAVQDSFDPSNLAAPDPSELAGKHLSSTRKRSLSIEEDSSSSVVDFEEFKENAYARQKQGY